MPEDHLPEGTPPRPLVLGDKAEPNDAGSIRLALTSCCRPPPAPSPPSLLSLSSPSLDLHRSTEAAARSATADARVCRSRSRTPDCRSSRSCAIAPRMCACVAAAAFDCLGACGTRRAAVVRRCCCSSSLLLELPSPLLNASAKLLRRRPMPPMLLALRLVRRLGRAPRGIDPLAQALLLRLALRGMDPLAHALLLRLMFMLPSRWLARGCR